MVPPKPDDGGSGPRSLPKGFMDKLDAYLGFYSCMDESSLPNNHLRVLWESS